ncbi:hypothetical protein Nepgr_025248 [Nepenthes gracilis]|uniref:Uncharacterized protein n=1 Tax=Nepenthes gracilis TaxID=150966 RepID=A0AAD3T4V3_NEPGR|nr:hypothetical protein Nepgr_025248 [Nepenthes gracilis]
MEQSIRIGVKTKVQGRTTVFNRLDASTPLLRVRYDWKAVSKVRIETRSLVKAGSEEAWGRRRGRTNSPTKGRGDGVIDEDQL